MTAIWLLLSVQDVDGDVDRHVRGLRSEEPAARDAAAAALVSLGHDALAALERHRRHEDPEVRARIPAVIEAIYRTDPLYLIRARPRRLTLDIASDELQGVFERALSPFNRHAPMGYLVGVNVAQETSFSIKESTFWDTIEALAAVSGSRVDIDDRGGLDFCTQGRGWFVASQPVMGLRCSARATDMYGETTFSVSVHSEPGNLLLNAVLTVDSIVDDAGRDRTKGFAARSDYVGPNVGYVPTLVLPPLYADPTDFVEGARLTLKGSASAWIAKRVETAEFQVEGFVGPQERTLGPCKIEVRALEARSDESFHIDHSATCPDDGKLFFFLVDDQRSICSSWWEEANDSDSCGGTEGRATRLVVLRVVEAERVEMPIDLRDIPVRVYR